MKCPRCRSKVEYLASGVDHQPILICSNPACGYERLPDTAPQPGMEAWEQQVQTSSMPRPNESLS